MATLVILLLAKICMWCSGGLAKGNMQQYILYMNILSFIYFMSFRKLQKKPLPILYSEEANAINRE